jgi:hypothetical protein
MLLYQSHQFVDQYFLTNVVGGKIQDLIQGNFMGPSIFNISKSLCWEMCSFCVIYCSNTKNVNVGIEDLYL